MFDIKLADKKIRIINLYSYLEELCREYIVSTSKTEGNASVNDITEFTSTDMTVKITGEDIEYERRKSDQEDKKEGIPVRHFDDDYLESLAIYRKIAEHMPSYDTFLFHGSCIAVDGQGYLFTAKSGTGKSTHAGLWKKLLGERVVYVNDDKPLIRVNPDGDLTVYGTPWAGKHNLNNNISVPLNCICLLERSAENNIVEITKSEAYPMLLQQVYRPADQDAMRKTLSLIDRMQVRLYRLCCNMDISSAELSYGVMSN